MLFRRLLLRIYHRAHRDHREAFLNPLSVISVGSVVDFAFCRSKLQRELLRSQHQIEQPLPDGDNLNYPIIPLICVVCVLGKDHPFG